MSPPQKRPLRMLSWPAGGLRSAGYARRWASHGRTSRRGPGAASTSAPLEEDAPRADADLVARTLAIIGELPGLPLRASACRPAAPGPGSRVPRPTTARLSRRARAWPSPSAAPAEEARRHDGGSRRALEPRSCSDSSDRFDRRGRSGSPSRSTAATARPSTSSPDKGIEGYDIQDLMIATVEARFGRVPPAAHHRMAERRQVPPPGRGRAGAAFGRRAGSCAPRPRGPRN